LWVTSDVEIIGPGVDVLTIDANGSSQVFAVNNNNATPDVTIRGLTISGGNLNGTFEGSGIYSYENLTLDGVVVTGNVGGRSGGGLFQGGSGNLTILNSTFDNNSALWGGGAVVQTTGSISINGSTFSNNDAVTAVGVGGSGGGGGLYLKSNSSGTPAQISNSTFSGNVAQDSTGAMTLVNAYAVLTNNTIAFNDAAATTGGILRVSGGLTLHNTIVAKNTLNGTTNSDVSGTLDAGSSYNLFGAGVNGQALTGGGNKIGSPSKDPKLEALADNGGPTRTHRLQHDSMTINQGSEAKAAAAGLVLDQRGFARTTGVWWADNGGDGATDIGAFEYGMYAQLDPFGALTIDDAESRFQQIVLSVGYVQNALRLLINETPTPYKVDEITRIEVYGTSGDDNIDLSGVNAYVLPNLESVTIDGGEEGVDVITGTIGDDRIISHGSSTTYVGPRLNGGEGNDVYVISPGEVYNIDEPSGAGFDTLDFSLSPLGVTIDLAIAYQLQYLNDEYPDFTLAFVGGIDAVIGTPYDDKIYGDSGDNLLDGRDGNDQIHGRDGNDTLVGGDGEDDLYGGDGDDTLRTNDGNQDNAQGGRGKDKFDPDDEDRSPPEFEDLGTIRVRSDQSSGVRLVAEDAESVFTDWTFSLDPAFEQPGSAAVSSDGILSWSGPTSSEGPGSYEVHVKVTDAHGLSDTQTVTVEEYNWNEAAPIFNYFQVSQDNGLESDAIEWIHGHRPNTGLTGQHYDLKTMWLEPQESTTLHVRINPYTDANAVSVDSQTINSALTYKVIDGMGSFSGNVYSADLNYAQHAGKTFKIEFEIEDAVPAGSEAGEVKRTRRDFLYVRVNKLAPNDGPEIAAPVAIDRVYDVPLDQSITKSIAAGFGSIGVYNPIFNDDAAHPPIFTLGSAEHGSVELLDGDADHPRGQFTYTPDTGFRGTDKFTYTIQSYDSVAEAYLLSNVGTVTLAVAEYLIADIDAYMPDAEEVEPGGGIVWNRDDDNGNGVADYLELNGPIAGEDDLLKLDLNSWMEESLPLKDFLLRFSGNVRFWDSPTKNREIIANDEILWKDLPETVWMEGVSEGPNTAGAQILNHGFRNTPPVEIPPNVNHEIPNDDVLLTPRGNLTAYRPMSNGPNTGYQLFGRVQVPEDKEDSNDFGPGIRINGDNDNGNSVSGIETPDYSDTSGPVANEDDLIEVSVATVAGETVHLTRSSTSIRVWTTADKASEIVFPGNGLESEDLNSVETVYVEWSDPNHGTAVLSLADSPTRRPTRWPTR
jgi:hypothetical protein